MAVLMLPFVPAWLRQKTSRTASCMSRGPPPPRNGLPIPTSGVTVIGESRCPVRVIGSILEVMSAAKLGNSGFEKFGWLKMLKISARS